jgi:hypothetical protein
MGSSWTNSPWSNGGWNNAGWNNPGWNGTSWQNTAPSTPWSNAWSGQGATNPMWNGGTWNASTPSGPQWNNQGWNNQNWNGGGWNTPCPTPSGWNGSQRPVFNNANGCTPNSGFTGNATNGCASGFTGAPSNYSNTGKPFPATPTSGQPISPAAPSGVYGGPNGAPQQYAAPVCQVPTTMMAESACCSGGARNAA